MATYQYITCLEAVAEAAQVLVIHTSRTSIHTSVSARVCVCVHEQRSYYVPHDIVSLAGCPWGPVLIDFLMQKYPTVDSLGFKGLAPGLCCDTGIGPSSQ